MHNGTLGGLPTGTVTFVLTDIQRSTALWEEHGEAMGLSVARHETIIERATEDAGGILVRSKGEGDSCFCVFPEASMAVRAVLDAQRALASEAWTGPSLRVRMAVHTGTAELRDGQYYGSVVNRCARLRGIAHGGQTLLSATTYELVRSSLPDGASLLDLGSHRLPDLTRPERVYQLCHPDLTDVFPPVNSLDSLPNNLPIQLTRFVNREREQRELAELLDEHRLVTLTGPGGSGKTRLALQVAAASMESFRDGVWLVGLGAVTDPSLLDVQIASTVGLREEPGRPLLDTIVDYLRRRSVLLIMDNCEHVVVPAAQTVGTLLASCANVKVIATSRQALAIEGEVARPLLPLRIPDSDMTDREALLTYGAAQLLRDRGALAHAGFDVTDENAAAVAHICRRLDGIPLAIEFAAARLGSLGPAELARRLDDRFRLLSTSRRTGPERHQTLDAAVDWSYELLDDHERLLFRRVAIFTGSFSLDGAEKVCSDDELSRLEIAELLTNLVDRSLVFADTHGETTNYRMLSTIRAFALARLEDSGEVDAMRNNHLRWFVRLAQRAEPELVAAEQARWFDTLTSVHDDIRAALAWAIRTDPTEALRLAAALGSFWDTRGHWSEGRRWLDDAIAASSEPSIELAHALRWSAVLAGNLGDTAAAVASLTRALDLSRRLGDQAGTAHILTLLGMFATNRGEVDEARALFDEALTLIRARGDDQRTVGMLINLAMAAQARNDAAAGELFREALRLSREHGHQRGIAASLHGLGVLAQRSGDVDRAKASFTEALDLFRGLRDNRGSAAALMSLARVARQQGELDEAKRLLAEALPLFREVGDRHAYAAVLVRLGWVASAQGDLDGAEQTYAEALAACREVGDDDGAVTSLSALARLARLRGEHRDAVVRIDEALELCRRDPDRRSTASCLEEAAALAIDTDPRRAATLFGATEAMRGTGGFVPADYGREIADLRASFADTDRFWDEGRQMTPADAVEFASRLATPSSHA